MASFTNDWNAAFAAVPAGTDNISDGDDVIRTFKDSIQEIVAIEHNFDLSNVTDQGTHKAGSGLAYYQSAAPTTRPSGDTLDSDDAGRLFYDTDDGSLSIWNGSAWVQAVSQFKTRLIPVDSITSTSTNTGNEIFDALDAYIPDTNNEMFVNGGINDKTVSKAVRTGATTIDLYGCSGSTGAGQVTVTNGSSTAYVVALAW